jgi:DNA-directed RNA polymerase specialized sigma24 family protein
MENVDITREIRQLIGGDQDAARRIVDHYFDRLTLLARRKLSVLPPQIADDEGAVISAFRSFFSGVQKKQFPQLNDREDLWKVLATITVRKAVSQMRRHWKASAEGGKLEGDFELERLLAHDPSPDDVAALVDECEHKIRSLADDTLRKIATLTLAGYETREIALQLGVHQRTIQRKLEIIRNEWMVK